jgi:hypothetical protein
MHTVVLLPTHNNSVDLDSTTTALNTAVSRPTGRSSKLAQFTLNYSNEMQQIIIQYIRIHHNRIYLIRSHYIMINPIRIPFIRIILPFSSRRIQETQFSKNRATDTPHLRAVSYCQFAVSFSMTHRNRQLSATVSLLSAAA